MDDLPIVRVPPCDELEIVVFDLYRQYTGGTLKALPASWQSDLNSLKSLCKEIPPQTAYQLAVLLRLPDEPEGDTP